VTEARTHALLARDYPDALAAVVAETLSRAEAAFVLVDHDERDESFDPAEETRETWAAVRDAFEALDGAGPFRDDAGGESAPPTGPGASTPDGSTPYRLVGEPAAVERLCSLAGEPVVGRWFLRDVRLTVDGDPVLGAVPHHSELWVDAAPLGEGYLDAVAAALADCRACLVPAGTRLAWTVDGRTYRLAGGSLCIEREEDADSCWGLARLQAVRREGSTLVLDWAPDGRPLPIRALSRGLRALLPGAALPERVPCGNAETAERARASVAETLAAFEPGESES